MTEKAQSAVAFEVKLVLCGMTVVGEEAQLQSGWSGAGCIFRREQCLQPSHAEAPCRHSPALNPIFKSSSSSDVSTSSSCASSAACGDEICMGAGLVLRISSC